MDDFFKFTKIASTKSPAQKRKATKGAKGNAAKKQKTTTKKEVKKEIKKEA